MELVDDQKDLKKSKDVGFLKTDSKCLIFMDPNKGLYYFEKNKRKLVSEQAVRFHLNTPYSIVGYIFRMKKFEPCRKTKKFPTSKEKRLNNSSKKSKKIKTIDPLCSSLFGLKIEDLVEDRRNVKRYLDKCLKLSKLKNNKDLEDINEDSEDFNKESEERIKLIENIYFNYRVGFHIFNKFNF